MSTITGLRVRLTRRRAKRQNKRHSLTRWPPEVQQVRCCCCSGRAPRSDRATCFVTWLGVSRLRDVTALCVVSTASDPPCVKSPLLSLHLVPCLLSILCSHLPFCFSCCMQASHSMRLTAHSRQDAAYQESPSTSCAVSIWRHNLICIVHSQRSSGALAQACRPIED